MTTSPGAFSALPSPVADRRHYRRVPLALLGRYRLATLQEYPCLSVDVSLGGLAILAPVKAPVGERVMVYLEQIGLLEGRIVRHTMWGFALALQLTARQRDRLAAQLDWLENRHGLGLPERRRHPRTVPVHSAVLVQFDDGRTLATRLINVSRSGAAVRLEPRPPVGTLLTLGETAGRVVRHLEGGVGVEFLAVLPRDKFNEAVVL